ncbi:MAG TPA: ROK family protein [Solirubrobacteraceae bacterium]|nr:ROK family protein [Solirubrobacteraceae bacterium]
MSASGGGAVIAVDLGGTTIKGAVVDADGGVSHELSRATPVTHGPDAVIAELLSIVSELAGAGSAGAHAVGLVVPGVVDAAAGRAVFSANVGFRDLPLRDVVQSQVGLPTVLEHDVYAAGVAERAVGAAAGAADHLLAVIGTGIAGVVHAAGRPVRGALGVAGELGHIPVWPGGERCPCGQRGCLERYASAAAIVRRYARLGGPPGMTAEAIAARRSTDPAAQRVWQEATEALAIALVTCTMLLDPELIIIAGGLSAAGEALRAPVQAELAERITWRAPPPVRLSPLGGRAGLIGAAILARQLV